MFFNAPNTPKNRIAAIIAIVLGLGAGFYIAVSGGKSDDQPVAEIAAEDLNAAMDVDVRSAPSIRTPQVPTVPKSLRLEDIDFTEYSEGMARFTGLEVGQSRIEAIDNVRLYFAPGEGADIIQTSQSVFERDDGAVMLFSAAGLPDDSVKAEEIFLILTGAKGNQTLQAFGSRIKCHRGENTTDWQNTLCP